MLEFIRSTTRRRDQVGASAVEYGLLIAGIAGMVVAIVFAFGPVVKNSFQGTCNRLKQGSTSTAQTC